jgi:hypothetical protein
VLPKELLPNARVVSPPLRRINNGTQQRHVQRVASGRWAERNRDLVELEAAELGLRLLIA